jgi:hypothetical protein
MEGVGNIYLYWYMIDVFFYFGVGYTIMSFFILVLDTKLCPFYFGAGYKIMSNLFFIFRVA